MAERRVGLWLVGAFGGVGGTVALGLAALQRGLTDTTSLTTALPLFAGLDLDEPAAFTLGGHDIRRGSFGQSATDLHERSNVFTSALLEGCRPTLEAWSANVVPGTLIQSGSTIADLADWDAARRVETPRQAVGRV